MRKKSKDYYVLLKRKKAQHPNVSLVLKRDFYLTEDQLGKKVLLPHIVCSEPYVKAFQYKVLSSILYTNTKLYKTGYIADDKCFFCKFEPETPRHLLFDCVYSKIFFLGNHACWEWHFGRLRRLFANVREARSQQLTILINSALLYNSK